MTTIPTITQLFNGVIASMNVQFGITIPTIGKNSLRDLGATWAGKLKLLYLYLGYIQKNAWFDTADLPMLKRFGNTFLQRDPYAPTQGQYTVTVTGTAGAVITANTTALSDPNSLNPNYLFILDTDYTLTGTADTITLRATTAGSIANLAIGNTLTFTKPIVNVQPGVTVTAITVSAADGETTEQYRNNIGIQVRLAPQGGSVSDYIIWGSPVEGVARIYPYTASGAAYQVNAFVEAILSDSGGSAPDYNYGIPTSTILDNVTAAILADPETGIARKPMGVVLGPANVGALAVAVKQVVITFTGSTGISPTDQAKIVTALQQATANIRPFIAGANSLASQNDTISVSLPATGGRLAPPEIYVIVVIAMAAAPGALFTGCTMTVGGTPATSYTFDDGEIPYLKGLGVGVLFT